MKYLLIIFFTLLSQSTFAGVGGSIGGDESVNNPEKLEYYLGYSNFIYNVPSVDFKLENSELIILPINKTCIRNNDFIESIDEVEVVKLDNNHSPIEKVKEIVSRERKFFKKASILDIFKKETLPKELAEIPRNYKINIRESGSRASRFLRTIDYTIKDCE